jgi:signal peptidase I
MRTVREMLITLLVAVAMFLVMQLTIQSSVVVGSSMEPTLENGQRLVVSKAALFFRPPERGDVVIFLAPNSQNTEFIKRVIGLPGDKVAVSNGRVIVNGKALEEPYIASPPRYTYAEQTVPENSYFVLGDNRNNSNDSHNGWTVPRQSIVGKGWLSIWPPGEWGLVPNYRLN